MWKAVATIVGDTRKDVGYWKRYRRYGLDRAFFETRIERLKRLRVDYDVAYHNLSAAAADKIRWSFGEVVSITAEVIRRYRDHLQDPDH